jgi:parallel beta-helix repeat protein
LEKGEMRNKTLTGMLLTIILTCASAAVFSTTQSFASSGTWHVDKRGPPYGNFKTVKEAIQNSSVKDGDTIVVHRGIYSERPYVNKSLRILALYPGETIVDGSKQGNVFTIAADNVTLEDFIVRQSADDSAAIFVQPGCMGARIINNTLPPFGGYSNGYGIRIESAENNLVYNNTVSFSKKYGIYLKDSNNNTISNNIISDTLLNGLHLENCSSNTINGNTLKNNRKYGIFLSNSGNNNLSGNIMTNPKYNFGIEGQFLEDFIQTINETNTVDGKRICYWVNRQNETVPADRGFIALINSSNITVNGSTLTKNIHGLLLVNTNNSYIDGLTIFDNEFYGIYSLSSHRNNITNNMISSSGRDGIRLEASSNNTMSENDIAIGTNEFDGISLRMCSGNEIKENTVRAIKSVSIRIIGSSNNTIDSNNITDCGDKGISLEDSVNNVLTNNSVTSMQISPTGIYLDNSSKNEIKMSTINFEASTNPCIALVSCSSNNSIYHNNFISKAPYLGVAPVNCPNYWNDSYTSCGNYWSNYKTRYPSATEIDDSGIWDTPYVINANNTDGYPLVNPITGVALTNITLSETRIGIGAPVDISVTVENQGVAKTTFVVKIYYYATLLKETSIANVTVTLESRQSTTKVYEWNTLPRVKGNYTIKAYADSSFKTCNLEIVISGNLNNDTIVNILDLVIEAGKFGKTVPPENPKYDLNKDGNINMLDLVLVVGQFGQTAPPDP